MIPLEPRLALDVLHDLFLLQIGAIWYITRKSFSWTHENQLFDQILDLECNFLSHFFLYLVQSITKNIEILAAAISPNNSAKR